MNYTPEHVALCALNRIFGYHPALAARLMEERGGATELFAGAPPALPEHPELAAQLGPDALAWAREELGRVKAQGARFVCLCDEDYPAALEPCEDRPLGLYVSTASSATEVFALHPMVGVVGTRDLSPYGQQWCRNLVKALADAPVQPVIVSGLAFGADAVAHRTALECGLPTVAVMPTGIGQVYPWRHTDLARQIAAAPGSALVTDYPMGSQPVALNFLRRNRIIAGLVRAVVVVESKSKGGSLMTARYAVDYDREVYALPGRIDDLRSEGCNSLIGSNMAQIITSPEELVGRLGLGARVRGAGGSWASLRRSRPGEDALQAALSRKFGPDSAALRVGLAVRDHRGANADELVALTGLPPAAVIESIGLLEAGGILLTDLLRRCSLLPPFV